LVGVLALEQLGDAAGELNDIDAALNFALSVAQHFAVLGGDGARQVCLVEVQQFQEAEHDACAPDGGRVGPAGKAAAAAATARSTSSAVPSVTWRATAPVAGL